MMKIAQFLAVVLLVQVAYVYGDIGARIVDGKNAYPGQFPYQVSIQYGIPPFRRYVPICGGSIINDQWVLTSSSCLSLVPRIGKIVVKAGAHNLKYDNDYVQTRDVSLKLLHQKFSQGIINRIHPYDIALLKLKSPLKLNERVQKVQLPKEFSSTNGTAILTGWGSVSKGYVPKFPKVLQVSNVSLITQENCEDALRTVAPHAELTDVQFCTGPLDQSVGACTGDLGDPLVQVNKKSSPHSPVQIGLVSWSNYPCGKHGSPTVYTAVSSFVDWIRERIEENKN